MLITSVKYRQFCLKQILLCLLISLVYMSARAQNDCPAGQEQIWVKCDGKIVPKCVPSRDNCGCRTWGVDYYEKDNTTKKWGSGSGTTYQELENAIEEKISNQKGI